MADFNFPGIDLSDPFVPSHGSISVYSPFEYSTPNVSAKPPHDYGTFTYPITPEDERPTPISLPLRSRNCSSNCPPSLSFSRSSSTSSKFSFSSSKSDITSNRLSNTKWEPLTSFPHFTSLPLDIQRNIWRHTLPGPQITEIYQYTACTPRSSSSSSTTITTQKEQEILPIFKTHTPLPIALRIHHLSRRLAQSYLTPLSFAQPYYLPSNPYAYINYTHDTIFLSSHTLYPDLGNHILYSRNLHKIRYLALEFKIWCELLGDNHFVNALLEMEELVSIGVVFEKGKVLAPSNFCSSSSSSIVSKRLGDLITNRRNTPKTTNPLRFVEPTEREEIELRDIFERECEKRWLWGRVSGWEDVRSKLRLRWKEEDCRSASTIPSRNHRGRQSYTRLRSGSGAKSDIQIGYEAPRDSEIKDSESRRGLGDGLESLESLLNSVDDVIMDYGYGAQGKGEWVEDTRGYGGGDEEREYSESEYSASVCSASLEGDSDLQGWI